MHASSNPVTHDRVHMLTDTERDRVFKCAYIPEHLPDYVQTVSNGEPYIHQGYLCFSCEQALIFIGYPLQGVPDGEVADFLAALESASDRFRPNLISVIAPRIRLEDCENATEKDQYFRLSLPVTNVRRDEEYMLRRAGRELRVLQAEFSKEHETCVENFIKERRLSEAHQGIFRSIRPYMARSQTARLLEARKGDELVAFTILDLGSASYGFYLFNFRSHANHVPGASDLLFHEMAKLAEKEGKLYLNLGLGVNTGVRRFKEKWGAIPFLPYEWATIKRKPRSLIDVIRGIILK